MQKEDKNGLQGYSLKFTKSQWKDIQIHLATNDSLKYKYQLFNKAITDLEHRKPPVALAFPLIGKTHTCYINSNLSDKLETLAEQMNCKPVTALFSIIIDFMKNTNREVA